MGGPPNPDGSRAAGRAFTEPASEIKRTRYALAVLSKRVDAIIEALEKAGIEVPEEGSTPGGE